MSQGGEKAQSRKELQKAARSKSGGKPVRKSKTTEPQKTLLDPPQIVKGIYRHFWSWTPQGAQFWSEIKGNDNLLGAWHTCVQAGRTETFWGTEYPSGIGLEHDELHALWDMRHDPRHLMAVCRNSSALNALCELFDTLGSLPSNRGVLFAHLVNALLSREEEIYLAKGTTWLGSDVIKYALAELAYEMKARLVIPYGEAQAFVSTYMTEPDQLIKAAASAGLLIVDETMRFADSAFQAYFASGKLGEMMDSGNSAVEFLPRDNWQMHRVWQEALVMLAGNRDPVRVASWVAEMDPLVAERCLTDSGHNLNIKDIDVAVLDLGKIAYRWFRAVRESKVSVGRNVDPELGFASLIARTADSTTPPSMKRLAYVLKQFVPKTFHPTTYDLLRIINYEDLSGFFGSLIFSKSDLQAYVKQLASLTLGNRKKKLILHIDDDTGVRALTQIMISRGFKEQVLVASIIGGAGGLILASILLPDLVLTDVMEPGMDGFTFAGYLKKNPVTSNVPFVFLTARGDPEAVKMGMELGAKVYLTKPILHKDLVAVLQEVIGIEV